MIDPLVDTEIPWWAVWWLDYEYTSPQAVLRRWYGAGVDITRKPYLADDDYEGWRTVVQEAAELAQTTTPQELIAADRKRAQHASLKDPRAMVAFAGMMNDDLSPIILKWFHVRALRIMRKYPLSVVLLPFNHGKSYLANYILPIMDWGENPETMQIRIFQSGPFVNTITNKLMWMVERHQGIHQLFPHIRRPEAGDPCEGIWSKRDGFAIGGKQVADPSFRALTVGGGAVGWRGDRIVGDDWVKDNNAHSPGEMDKMEDYLYSSAITMRQMRSWEPSKYGTKWGTFSLIGTLYDNRDVNTRTFKRWKQYRKENKHEYKTLKLKVYPFRHSREHQEVIWPEVRPYPEILKLEDELGQRGFQLRCQNTPLAAGEVVFSEEKVRQALRSDLKFGDPPFDPGHPATVIIGFDPGSGGRSRATKYPACVVLAFPVDSEFVHFVEWARWRVPQPEQVRRLIAMARKYDAPIVVETNTLQRSYKEWIEEQAPQIQVYPHQTTEVKHNWEDGVEQFKPLFDHDLVAIHANGADKYDIDALTGELIDWPQAESSDLVMAAWFARYRYRQRFAMRATQNLFAPPPLPVYARRRFARQVIDLRQYRQ